MRRRKVGGGDPESNAEFRRTLREDVRNCLQECNGAASVEQGRD